MSNPTSNFGWQMPTPTDLVTDLPADFEVFGQAVDTSMADLKGGTTGQILSKATNTDMDFTWVSPNPGDITGITATSPLTGGGTSGDVTVGIQASSTTQSGAVQLEDSTSSTSTTKAATPNSVKTSYDLANAAIPKSLVDAKGDVLTATADNTPARLAVGANETRLVADSVQATGLKYVADTTNYAINAKGDLLAGTAADTLTALSVGTNGQTLVADSTTATGLKWATPSSGAMTKITSATFTAVADTGTTFDGVFTDTYNNYFIEIAPIKGSVSSANLNFQLRKAGPTTQAASYYGNRMVNSTLNANSNTTSFTLMLLETETGGVTMNFYRDGTPTCWTTIGFQRPSFAVVTGACMNDGAGANTATGLILSAGSGTITGTVAVYGLAD
jgi:hypothetical protein